MRLVQTCASDLNYWSVQELRLYQTAPAGPAPDPARRCWLWPAKRALISFTSRQALAGFVPRELRPRPQASSRSQAWPLVLPPRSVLPGDLTGVMVAVEAHDAPRLIRFLERQGAAFQRAQVGGHALFWKLSPPSPGQRVPLIGVSLRSSNPGSEVRLLDGNQATAWDSGKPQQAGDFVELSLPAPRRLCGLVLDNRPNPLELPRGLMVALSVDGKQWQEVSCRQAALGPLVFAGDSLLSSQEGRMRLSFAPTTARFLRLSLSQGHPRERWSIYELGLEEAPEQP